MSIEVETAAARAVCRASGVGEKARPGRGGISPPTREVPMKKLKLALDNLAVESFSTDRGGYWTGTVDARSLNTMDQCNTQAADCTMGNPCTSDGYATLDAVLCAGSAGTTCGSDQTIAVTTC